MPILQIELICCPLPSPDGHCQRVGVQIGSTVSANIPYAGLTEARFTVAVEAALAPDGMPRYKGKPVQGSAAQPFLYLCWGDWLAGVWKMERRSKIQLQSLPTTLLAQALASGRGLRARLSLVDARGGAASGSLKADQVAWSLAE